jgi:hypothetical protein
MTHGKSQKKTDTSIMLGILLVVILAAAFLL